MQHLIMGEVTCMYAIIYTLYVSHMVLRFRSLGSGSDSWYNNFITATHPWCVIALDYCFHIDPPPFCEHSCQPPIPNLQLELKIITIKS